jgi:hypothetical protein
VAEPDIGQWKRGVLLSLALKKFEIKLLEAKTVQEHTT